MNPRSNFTSFSLPTADRSRSAHISNLNATNLNAPKLNAPKLNAPKLNGHPKTRKVTKALLWLLASCSAAFAGTVTVSSPVNGSNVTSPVHVHATYNGTVTASFMKVWVDHVAGTVQLNTNVFDLQINLANGAHLVEVQAKDGASGVVYTTPTNFTVATLALNPASVSMAPGSLQQFQATDSSGASITWSATGGSISSGGLYTAGSTAGTFAVTATDSSGNKAVSQVNITSAHTVTIQSPLNGSSVTSPVAVKATYNGTVVASFMKMWVDHVAGTVEPNTNVFTTSVYLSSGSHIIEIQASDPSTGQVYTTPTTFTVIGGVTVSPASVTLQTGGTQQFTANDSAGLPVTWSATGGTITSSGLFTAGSAAGAFSVTATDSSNSSGRATITVQSSTSNAVTVQNPVNGSTVSSPVNVQASYNGAVTATYMKVWVDHVAGTVQQNTSVFATSLTLSNGAHFIEVQAKDASTAVVYTTGVSITVSSPPAGTVTVSPGSVTLQPGGTQQFRATDGFGLPVAWAATGGTISNSGLYTAGTIAGTFAVTATDSSNNVGRATITVQNSTVSISPKSVYLQPGVTQQFTATDSAGLPITWSATGGTITNAGLYTPGATVGSFTVTATDSNSSTANAAVTIQPAGTSLNYTTWKNDNLRTGQQTNEAYLAPANVNATHFGVRFSNPVDGALFAQPLYLANLSVAGATHNVVFVCTENDSVYAFDADVSGAPLWKVNLIPAGGTTVPQSLVGSTIYPAIGITGTPVIDSANGTLYVVAETLESNNVVFRLHALDVTSGKEQGNSPVVISTAGWQPKEQLQRPGLLLSDGNVYIAFGSQGDHLPYSGWIFSYSASSLAQVGVWSVASKGQSAIWMAGAAPAADAAGNIYVLTGNGLWDGNSNFSDSFVKLSPNLTVLDYFTPYNQAILSADDQDLGSGGILLIPDLSGAFPREVIGCGKYPAIYALNGDNMGKFQSTSNGQIIQEVDNQVGGTTGRQAPDRCFTTPAYWQQTLYFSANNDTLKAFSLDPTTGKMSTTPTSKGTYVFGFPGGQPVVSSNGATNGVVWVMEYSPAVALHAYDASNLANELYRSASLGGGAKFVVPTVVNGKVYVGTGGKLIVFGSL